MVAYANPHGIVAMHVSNYNLELASVAAGIAEAEAQQVVDVSGLFVTPGLVDIHVHAYAEHTVTDQVQRALWRALHEPEPMPSGLGRLGFRSCVAARAVACASVARVATWRSCGRTCTRFPASRR